VNSTKLSASKRLVQGRLCISDQPFPLAEPPPAADPVAPFAAMEVEDRGHPCPGQRRAKRALQVLCTNVSTKAILSITAGASTNG
jgi:hypothetical protein